MNKLVLFLICGWPSFIFCQSIYSTKDSVYLFWQEGIRITYDDYKGRSFPNKMTVVAETGIWTVLDLPENQNILTKDQMLFYIAPVCDRTLSHADSNDSILIAVNNIYFDINEVVARSARKKLNTIKDSIETLSAASFSFKAIVKDMHENRLRMSRKFYRDFFRNNNKEALRLWRDKLNNDLKNTSEWATSPIECYRFIYGKPIQPGFKEDLSSNPVLLLDKYEQVLAVDSWHAGFNQISRLRMGKK